MYVTKIYGNGQSELKLSYNVGDTYGELDAPTRNGWSFGGWYADADFTRKVTAEMFVPFGGATIYAKWERELAWLESSRVEFADARDEWSVVDAKSPNGYLLASSEYWSSLGMVVSGTGFFSFYARSLKPSGWGDVGADIEEGTLGELEMDGWTKFGCYLDGSAQYIEVWGYWAQIGGFAFESYSKQATLADWLEKFKGYHCWVTDNLPAIGKSLTAEFNTGTTEDRYKARLKHALTTVLAVAENAKVKEAFTSFGYSIDFRRFKADGTLDLTRPTASNGLVDDAMSVAEPAIKTALDDLDAISSSWKGSFVLSPSECAFVDEDVFVDLGDILYLKAMLKGTLGCGYYAKAYNTELDYSKLLSAERGALLKSVGSANTLKTTSGWASIPYLVLHEEKNHIERRFKAAISGDAVFLYLKTDSKPTDFWVEATVVNEVDDWEIDIGSSRYDGEGDELFAKGAGFMVMKLPLEEVSATAKSYWLKNVELEAWNEKEDTFDWLFWDCGDDLTWTAYKEQTGLFSRVRNAAALPLSKQAVAEGLDLARAADAIIMARTDGELHLLEYDLENDEDMELREKVFEQAGSVRKSLDGAEWSLDLASIWPETSENGIREPIAIVLGNVFSGKLTRSSLPKSDSEDVYVPQLGSLRDATFGGVLKTMTKKKWQDILDAGEWDYTLDGTVDPVVVEKPTVTVAADPLGSGTGTATGGATATAGSKLYLKATPVSGSYFDGWYVDGSRIATAASYTYVVPEYDVTVYALFRKDVVVFGEVEDVECDAGEALEISIECESGSAVTCKATGLPKGLKFDSKKLLVSGTPTAPGVSKVVITATNKSKSTATLEFMITVNNFRSDYFAVEENVELDPGVEVDPIDLSSCGVDFDNGETMSVSGLPKGLSWNAKTLMITGKPTVPGFYTVTFSAKVKVQGANGKTSTLTTVATATWRVLDFPLLTLTPVTDTEAAGGTVTGGGNYMAGTKVTLRATAAKDYVFAGWFGLDESRTSGDLRSPTLTYVAGSDDEEVLAYFVSKSEDAESLAISLKTPRNVDDPGWYWQKERDDESYVGVQTIQQVTVASLSLPTVKVSGLPTGLKFNSKTYEIYGIPTRAGSYTVKVKATNASGASLSESFSWKIQELPKWAVGTFVGRLYLSIHPNGGEHCEGKHEYADGVLTMTVGTGGRISGKLQAQGKTYSFSANGFESRVIERSENDMGMTSWPRLIAEIQLKVGGCLATLPIYVEERGASEDAGTGIGVGGIYEGDCFCPVIAAPASLCCWELSDLGQVLSCRKDVAKLTARTYAKCLTGEGWSEELGESGWLTVKATSAGRITLIGRIHGNAVTATAELVIGAVDEEKLSVWSFPSIQPNKRTGFAGGAMCLDAYIRDGGMTDFELE